MERLEIPSYSFATKNYCLLMKPGIMMGNIVVTAGGFALASKGTFDIPLFIATLFGLALIIASSCVFNNYIDRETDKKMERTKNRGLATGAVSAYGAILFAVILGISGAIVLYTFTNLITVIIALTGFFVYVILYSFSKYYSIHGTIIGSVAGAIPPVVGYCAVSNRVDAAAVILFFMMVMWQMPHFFAIAIYRIEDYVQASIPIMPVTKGMRETKIYMMLYIIAFTAVVFLLTAYGYTSIGFSVIAALLGAAWLWLCVKGFYCKSDKQWARQMFVFSLVVVMTLYVAIPFTVEAAS